MILIVVLALLFNVSADAQCSCYTVHNVAVVGPDSMALSIKNTCDNSVYLNLYVISTIAPYDTLGRQETNSAHFLTLDTVLTEILSTTETTAPAFGTYRVSLGNGNITCDSLSFATTSGLIEQPAVTKLNIYPNPSSGTVTILLDASLGEQNILIFNGLGQVVRQLKSQGEPMIRIERAGLAAGMYFVRVMGGASEVANGALVLMD